MTTYFFAFEKKKNSTKQPVLNTGTIFTVDLKDDTSMLKPVLLLTPTSTGMPNPFTPAYFNYSYIPSFGRYYFIDDVQYVLGHWEFYLTVDVLASFKTGIGTTSAYIERSASASDSNLIDGFYPIKDQCSIVVTDFGTILSRNTGCYIVGITDCINSQSRVGAVTYYAMTESELNSLLQFLYSGSIYTMSSITDITEGLYKSIMNPMQYIVSCMWLPVARDTAASGSAVNVCLGYWQATGVSSKLVDGWVTSKDNRVSFPNHPQAASRGNYLNYSPFSKYTLYCPPFGGIPIDSMYRNVGTYLNIKISIDCVTGQGSLRVSVQNDNALVAAYQQKTMVERCALVGVPIQLSQVNTDMLSGVTGIGNSIISAITGNYAGAASGIMNAAAEVSQTSQNSLGYNGSFLETFNSTILVSEFYTQADTDNTDHGKPLMSTRTINTLSGYIKCSDGHFDGACLDTEKTEINNYMISGFFYE